MTIAAEPYRYEAFLSYRHDDPDRRVAERLHRFLENYRVPATLVAKGVPERVLRIFRDRDELPTSSDLGAEIETALRESLFLVVICSPRTPDSQWVTKEVETFIRLGRADRILTLLVEGEPAEAFPAPLLASAAEGATGPAQAQPLAADLRGTHGPDLGKLPMEGLRLLAPMLGCHFDDLRRRHLQRRRRRQLAAAAMVSAVALAFGGAVLELRHSRAARDRAEVAADLYGLADNLRQRWGLIEAVPVLDDLDRQMMADARRQFPLQADLMIGNHLTLMMTTRAEQIRGILHDYPAGAPVGRSVLAAAARLGIPPEALRKVHDRAERADAAAESLRNAFSEAPTYLGDGKAELEALYPRLLENAQLRTGLYTEIARGDARALAAEVCRAGCPAVETAWLAKASPRDPSELVPLLARAVEERRTLAVELRQAVAARSAEAADVLAIKPEDGSQEILGKTTVLRAMGRLAEALAGFVQWRARFAAEHPDLVPLVAAAEQLTRQHETLRIDKAAYIVDVPPDSEAARVGLQPGDLVVAYDGAAIGYAQDFVAATKANAGREAVTIDILRRQPDGSFERRSLTVKGGRLGITVAGI